MSDSPVGKGEWKFNIIRQRASPTEVILQSGHKVEKEDRVYWRKPNEDASGPGEWSMVKCADYHGEHFVYIDPVYETTPSHRHDPDYKPTGRGHWFAMCTCGSPAVIVGPKDAALEDSGAVEQLLVCYVYHHTLDEYGFGSHADQAGRRRWT